MSTHDNKLLGLQTLVGFGDTRKIRTQYDTTLSNSVDLGRHPFGLPYMGEEEPYRYRLLAHTGITEKSVEAMRAVTTHLIQGITADTKPYLRIIKVHTGQSAERRQAMYRLFFEIEMYQTVHIVGGCNDFSGEGGEGGRRLSALFALVAEASDAPLQISRPRTAEGATALAYIDGLF